MNSYERMNDAGTRDLLIQAARPLFARDGYRGTSIRAITAAAGTNLGAVTYHFGSKRELFNAVLEDAVAPVRAHITTLADAPGDPIRKIDETVRGLFAALRRDPVIPRLVVHVLASQDPLPTPIRNTMKTVMGHLSNLIQQGQRDGSVRDGSPQMLALASGSQPIFFGIYRRALKEAIGLDLSDDDTSHELTETVIDFITGGLASPSEGSKNQTERNQR